MSLSDDSFMAESKTGGTAVGRTYGRIKRDILCGTLAPDAKLTRHMLRTRYSASHSTLGEVLSRLVGEGLVDHRTQRGFFVSSMSPIDLAEVRDLWMLIECHALRNSLIAADLEWEANLVAVYHKTTMIERDDRYDNRGSGTERDTRDREFHRALIEACGSKTLLSLHARIFDRLARYQRAVTTDRYAKVVQEHQHLFEAALDRDSLRAVTLLKVHIELEAEHILSTYGI